MNLKKILRTNVWFLKDQKYAWSKGQSILEYAMLFAIVASALTAMHIYVQRSVQSNLKMIEDRVNAEPTN